MSALYTAVRLAGDWVTLPSALSLDGVFDTLVDALPLGTHRGQLRLADGQEVGFRATVTDVHGEDGVTDGEIFVDDANVAKLAAAESELTRLRAALQAIADRQPAQHVGEPHRGERHVDKKSAYYAGVFDGRKDGLHEASSLAAKALGGGT